MCPQATLPCPEQQSEAPVLEGGCAHMAIGFRPLLTEAGPFPSPRKGFESRGL